jgi:hypothetical protein
LQSVTEQSANGQRAIEQSVIEPKCFRTKMLSDKNAFGQKCFRTEMLLDKNALGHKRFWIKMHS